MSENNFFVVGVGASAGGLRALEEFFENMPSDNGAAFIVIQHLSPDFKSLMKELLERHTRMNVQRVEEGRMWCFGAFVRSCLSGGWVV